MTAVATTENEQRGTGRNYEALLARLSRQSVDKHFDAYADVAWDEPEMAVDGDDPRWELSAEEPLGATEWYRSLPAAKRSRLGLDLVASKMKIGLEFESVLKRGLLEYAATLPNGSPEYRYAYHEVIEEAQHSLMFQEFVNRSGFDARGLSRLERLGTHAVIALGRRFPPLFFVFVLGGEDPIDHVQRRQLRREDGVHPLLERIMSIHVTEEARHLSFARHYLKRNVPRLGRLRRSLLAIGAPLVLSVMARQMLEPSAQVVARHRVPRQVVADTYRRNPRHTEESLAAMAKLRRLWVELGLAGPASRRLWRLLKVAPASAFAGSAGDA